MEKAEIVCVWHLYAGRSIMRESTRACQGHSSVLEPARVQYYLRRGCSWGNFAAGRATVPAAVIELFYGIAGGNFAAQISFVR